MEYPHPPLQHDLHPSSALICAKSSWFTILVSGSDAEPNMTYFSNYNICFEQLYYLFISTLGHYICSMNFILKFVGTVVGKVSLIDDNAAVYPQNCYPDPGRVHEQWRKELTSIVYISWNIDCKLSFHTHVLQVFVAPQRLIEQCQILGYDSIMLKQYANHLHIYWCERYFTQFNNLYSQSHYSQLRYV